ncbi:uncharacterized protein [Penaeus vannamei]|uniref:uncharacterized protein n=1 Tax=Penaeus vannamei TaxID=6689 RepID=UPI00387F8962
MSNIDGFQAKQLHNYAKVKTNIPRTWFRMLIDHIHKTNVPMRPILSVIGTINYNVSKFFIPLLKKLTINEYTIQNTFTFIGELMTISNANDYVLASFDVSNLFTNVPLDETLSIIMDSLFDNIEGVAMGSPLGPTLANIFMCHYEKIWLQDCPTSFKPCKYFRYVDDTLLLFSSQALLSLQSGITPFSYNNFEILDSSQCDLDLNILESIWIWTLKPNLNEYLSFIDTEILR